MTIDALSLVSDLRGAGFSVWTDGGVIKISPFSRLTDAQRAALIAAKPDVIQVLAAEHQLRRRLHPHDDEPGRRQDGLLHHRSRRRTRQDAQAAGQGREVARVNPPAAERKGSGFRVQVLLAKMPVMH